MGRVYHGLILEVFVHNGLGKTKERPVVVIERDEHIDRDSPFLTIPITDSYAYPLPYYHIQVHDSYVLDRNTGLYKPSVAKCNWPIEVEARRISRKIGDMPDRFLLAICDVYDRIQADEAFDDWQPKP